MKRFSLSKIQAVVLSWGGESSYDSILIFVSYFFNGNGSLNHCYFLGGGTGRGAGRERWKVCEGGAEHGHVSFLSASETASFFEAFFPFLWSKLPWLFFGVDVHGVGVPGGGIPGRGGGMESDWGSGCMLLGDRSCEASLTKELVNFLVPSFGCSGDYFHSVDLI